ncbi:MAG TPA: S41 family peptidase [Steroidobacteraceae bacterium]|nr:S41 family peptidase [Steroidobacteraceae bacterium]
MQPRRTLLAILLGCLLGVSLAWSAAWVAGGGRGAPGLRVQDARLLSEVIDRIRADYVDRTDDRELLKDAIRGMVGELDPHSAFMDANEFEDLRIATEGNYSGIGVEVTAASDAIVVIAPIDGSPAARAGIRAGDTILAVDGSAVGDSRLADTIARIRGEPGTVVNLSIGRKALPDPIEIAVERAIVAVHSVRHQLLEPGVGYLRISQFSDTTGPDVGGALRALRRDAGGELSGIVLDLRNNPGGVLDAAVEVSDAFLESGLIVSAEGRSKESRFRMEAGAGDLARGARIAVLVNEGSASAAEIVAGALRDNGRAKLLGQRTFGKGSVQTVMPIGDGQALKLTTSRYYTPSGASIHERGLEPDIALPVQEAAALTGDGALLERDADVRAAVAWLKHGKAAQVAAQTAPDRR